MKALALLLVLTATAHAEDVCDDAIVDPVPVPVRAGGFDAPRSACLRSDLELRTGAHALVDTPNFYGTLGGDLSLGIRFVEPIGLEWGASLRVADATFAQTAVLAVTEVQYGPATAHLAMDHVMSPDLHLAGVLAIEVPFTRSDVETSTAGAQLGGVATWRAHDRLAVHGRLATLGWYSASIGGTSTRGAIVASSDAAIRTTGWLDTLVGLEVSAGWYRGGVDHLAARLGVHWRVRSAWRVDVGALVPVAGAERLDLAFTLGVRRDR